MKGNITLIVAMMTPLLFASPAKGEDRICVKTEFRGTPIKNMKARWNGEIFTVRYFYDPSEEGFVRLVYWTRGGTRKEIYDDLAFRNFISGGKREWVDYQVALPEQPARYQLERAYSYCTESRPKTFWERVDDALR